MTLILICYQGYDLEKHLKNFRRHLFIKKLVTRKKFHKQNLVF